MSFYVNIILGDSMEEEKIVVKRWIMYAIILIVIILSFLNFFTDVFIGKEKKQFKKDVEQLITAIIEKCEQDKLDGLPHNSIYDMQLGIESYKLPVVLETQFKGIVSVNNDCKTTTSLYNDSLKVIDDAYINLTIKNKNSKSVCKLVSGELEIGKEVECNDQFFNVIEINDDNVVLLSKYNINIETNRQDESDTKNPSINALAFDEVNNRTNPNNTYCQRTQYGCNIYAKMDTAFINGTISGTINEDSSIKPYVDSYALMLDLGEDLISTSLITKEQLEKLGCSSTTNDCTLSGYEWLYNTTYWTSSYFEGSPSIVFRIISGGFFGSSYANYDNNTGLRPVITILKSKIIK